MKTNEQMNNGTKIQQYNLGIGLISMEIQQVHFFFFDR